MSTKFSFLTVETTGSYTMLQPAVGVKLTGAPGLAVGLEAGFRVLLSDEVTLADETSEDVLPFGTSDGFLDLSLGFSF